jgi:small Trp-rich protein
MYLLVIGLLLLLMKWADFGPVGNWPWWVVIAPFILAVIWFEAIEPALGLDKKKAHDDIDKIKQARIRKALERQRPR